MRRATEGARTKGATVGDDPPASFAPHWSQNKFPGGGLFPQEHLTPETEGLGADNGLGVVLNAGAGAGLDAVRPTAGVALGLLFADVVDVDDVVGVVGVVVVNLGPKGDVDVGVAEIGLGPVEIGEGAGVDAFWNVVAKVLVEVALVVAADVLLVEGLLKGEELTVLIGDLGGLLKVVVVAPPIGDLGGLRPLVAVDTERVGPVRAFIPPPQREVTGAADVAPGAPPSLAPH